MTKRNLILLPLLLSCSLLFNSCGTNQVISTLEAVVTASQAAVNVLGATGAIPPSTVTIVDAYLTSVSQAASFAASELASSDSNAQKITKIVQQFAAITAPNLPPGTAQEVIAVIQAVTSAISNFLQSIQAPKTALAKLPNLQFSAADLKRLSQIHDSAQKLVQTINHRP